MTKTDHILYGESFTNLIQYSRAMPQYDDLDRPKKKTDGGEQAKEGGMDGVKVVKQDNKTEYKCSNFRSMFSALRNVTGK